LVKRECGEKIGRLLRVEGHFFTPKKKKNQFFEKPKLELWQMKTKKKKKKGQAAGGGLPRGKKGDRGIRGGGGEGTGKNLGKERPPWGGGERRV